MPKCDINYENTVIYKICCKNKEIKDVYVGHTTNFINRKYQHKLSCINNKNNCKIYKTIMENGGWDNWEMLEIATYNCKNATEARMKEQEHYELLNPTLNTVSPFSLGEEFCCLTCNFKTLKRCDWKRHIVTKRHINNIKKNNVIENSGANNNNIVEPVTHKCDCGKSYSSKSNLCKHKKKCKHEEEKISDNKHEEEKKLIYDLIKHLMKENCEIKSFIMEQNNKFLEQMILLKNNIEASLSIVKKEN
jgi:hypothetical protein